MFCKKCGKQVQDESMFCKYCGSNDLNNLQPRDEGVQLNTNFNEASVSSISPKDKNKNTSVIIINLCFIVIVLLASIFFVPFKRYYIGVVTNNFVENDTIEYHHLFNYPKEENNVRAKPPNGTWGDYHRRYNIFYSMYSIRFIALSLLYILVRKNYRKNNFKAFLFKVLSLKNIVLTLYIILLLLITIIYTPYAKFVYSSGKLLFTGERGFYPLFRFNDLIEVTKNENIPFIYNIDFRVLLLEVVVLTVIFLIIYLNIRKEAK
jgi:hypothetical protein